jgi:hypothetical protein
MTNNDQRHREYTLDQTAINLSLLEGHLQNFIEGRDTLFCVECINKHLLTITGYAQEGKTFWPADSTEYRTWDEIIQWADQIRGDHLKDLGRETAKEMLDQARAFRKKLTPGFQLHLYGHGNGGPPHAYGHNPGGDKKGADKKTRALLTRVYPLSHLQAQVALEGIIQGHNPEDAIKYAEERYEGSEKN